MTIEPHWDKPRTSRNTDSTKKKWRHCWQTNIASYQEECNPGNEQWDNKRREKALVWLGRLHTDFHEWVKICCWWDQSLNSGSKICLLTPVESKEALITQDFLKTVKTVLVHQLPNNRATATLVLHAGLHQIYRIYCSGSYSYK